VRGCSHPLLASAGMRVRLSDRCCWLAGAASLALVGCAGGNTTSDASRPATAPPPASTSSLATRPCRAGGLTPEQTEGPYYKEGSPERAHLATAGVAGQKLILSGSVRSAGCRPVGHAELQFWQADAGGQYDNSGFRLRGHEFTDARGSYRVQTIVPGLYTGRTRHIHVKVQAPGGPVLTTQLYFPDQPENRSDAIFDPALVLPVSRSGPTWTARFDFVIRT
jgi:protocatechuate 3,4-dioxygenase beta subunit